MTPEQDLSISTLLYMDAFHTKGAEGHTVQEILCDKDGSLKSSVVANKQTGFNDEQWKKFLNQVCNDPSLASLKVVDVTRNEYDGGYMATLRNGSTREAVIAYQGTASPEGWNEDFKTGYDPLTKSQKRALIYADDMREKVEGYYVYATGHSKGGNEAALIAAECDFVDQAHAFDAPGNSPRYFDDPIYAAMARDNSYKIDYYSNENCFVSPMIQRYGAKEHWIHTDLNEWEECEGLKAFLDFSPYAHSTSYLMNSQMLNGNGEMTENEANEPSQHVKEINRFSLWLTNTLPEEDSRYVLDATGLLIKDIMLLKDAAGNIRLKEFIDDVKNGMSAAKLAKKYGSNALELYNKLSQISITGLDSKALAILLAALEEYPYADELADSLFSDELQALIELGQSTPNKTTFRTFLNLFIPAGPLILAFINLTKAKKEYYRLKWGLKDGKKLISDAAQKGISALFHTHDFSDAKLAQLERLTSNFKSSPIRSLYKTWKNAFGGNPFFAWINLSFIQSTIENIISMLDGAIDNIMRTIRRKFQEAWDADARYGKDIVRMQKQAQAGTKKLRQILS